MGPVCSDYKDLASPWKSQDQGRRDTSNPAADGGTGASGGWGVTSAGGRVQFRELRGDKRTKMGVWLSLVLTLQASLPGSQHLSQWSLQRRKLHRGKISEMGIHGASLLSSSGYNTKRLKFSASAQKLTLNFCCNPTYLRNEALRFTILKTWKDQKKTLLNIVSQNHF